jgi:hypothetical protein
MTQVAVEKSTKARIEINKKTLHLKKIYFFPALILFYFLRDSSVSF